MSFYEPKPKPIPIDPDDFGESSFDGEQGPKKPNVYMELGELSQDSVDPSAEFLELRRVHDTLNEVQDRNYAHPETELSQIEASILYGVDKDLPASFWAMADGIKKDRGERDYEQVKGLIIERLRSEQNVIQTSQALTQVVEGLGLNPEDYSPNLYIETLKAKMLEWEENGIFDYLTIELIRNNNRHNIVPVPNDERIGEEQIVDLAKKFGEGQPYVTWVDEHLTDSLFGNYRFADQPNILSGYSATAGQIRLDLMPSKFNADLGGRNVEQQVSKLGELRAHNPQLNFRVPSLASAVAHWFILQNQGDLLIDEASVGKTFIRHFDIAPQELGGFLQVPDSCVEGGGGPYLSGDAARVTNRSRAAVG